MATWPLPTDDDKENLLLSCRYDDLDEVKDFVTKFGSGALSSVHDDNGNTVLHMTCGNGHIDVLDYLLPLVSPSILSAQNNAGSTALHWAAVNQHLEVAQKLVRFTGVDAIDIKNKAGRSPLGEAEMIGWDEGARWFVQEMRLDETNHDDVNDNEEDGLVDAAQDVEVEIQDADGQVAKMTISSGATT
ncbi:ankyrin repeat-containing domain protein [Suillus bovinus]|uniref:ankyrin repeat-containing domain protein n=1 Tax=Suillus bovinus TaxID=48563 RepID=UPI001B860F80|nr:ankyrin repeat-containing domain protein [Suillus bovinus]KAG2142254.1 ankyrin repeat-containing domain protein [Suillus bovinus]